MQLIVGPCMFAAPVIFVLAILAIPLWPVAIALTFALVVLVWPLERLFRLAGTNIMRGWGDRVLAWFLMALRPWKFFELPAQPGPEKPPK